MIHKDGTEYTICELLHAKELLDRAEMTILKKRYNCNE